MENEKVISEILRLAKYGYSTDIRYSAELGGFVFTINKQVSDQLLKCQVTMSIYDMEPGAVLHEIQKLKEAIDVKTQEIEPLILIVTKSRSLFNNIIRWNNLDYKNCIRIFDINSARGIDRGCYVICPDAGDIKDLNKIEWRFASKGIKQISAIV